jgi:hypothetical protein
MTTINEIKEINGETLPRCKGCNTIELDPDNRNNPLYQYSESLLLTIYNQRYDTDNIKEKIMPAPDLRTLCEFGGRLTIADYNR